MTDSSRDCLPTLMAADTDGPPQKIFNDWSKALKDVPSAYKTGHKAQLYLIFSLLVHFKFTLLQFFIFVFTSEKSDVRGKARGFTQYSKTSKGKTFFGPLTLWELWTSRFPSTVPHLQSQIIQPSAFSLARLDVENAIDENALKVRFKTLSVRVLRETLSPSRLINAYRTAAPFLFSLLLHLLTTENRYRREKRYKARPSAAEPEPEPIEGDNEEESEEESSDSEEGEEDARLQFHERQQDFSAQDEELDDENPQDASFDKAELVCCLFNAV